MEGGRKVRWEVDRDGSRRGKREKGERMGEGEPVFFLGGGCGEEEKKECSRRGKMGVFSGGQERRRRILAKTLALWMAGS